MKADFLVCDIRATRLSFARPASATQPPPRRCASTACRACCCCTSWCAHMGLPDTRCMLCLAASSQRLSQKSVFLLLPVLAVLTVLVRRVSPPSVPGAQRFKVWQERVDGGSEGPVFLPRSEKLTNSISFPLRVRAPPRSPPPPKNQAPLACQFLAQLQHQLLHPSSFCGMLVPSIALNQSVQLTPSSPDVPLFRITW